MNTNETETLAFMVSVRNKYFPDISKITFEVIHDKSRDGVMGSATFGKSPKVILHYSDDRIIQPCYRMGLVPVIAHELAHYIDPVDPERIMRERLPTEMMTLWKELFEAGYAKCSMTTAHPIKKGK